jgi:hypothetical protein
MKRLVLLFVCSIVYAQTPVVVQFGGLYCAAIRRPSFKIQTYCYQYPANPTWTLLHNQIDTVSPGGTLISYAQCIHIDPLDTTKCSDIVPCKNTYGGIAWYQFEVDAAIVWKFTRLNDGTIKYEYSIDGMTLVSGILT